MSMYSGRRARAASVIACASAVELWSFQSQIIAFGLSANRASAESGTPTSDTGSTVVPVASIPIPTIAFASKPSPALSIASRTESSIPLR